MHTEAQVQTIIDAAVENCLTEDDIDAIIADLDTGLTKDEVKKLINNANAGYLTYAQIVNLIEDESYALRKFLEDKLETDLGTLEDDLQKGQTVQLKVTTDNKVNNVVTLDETIMDTLVSGGSIMLDTTDDWSEITLKIDYNTAKIFRLIGGTAGNLLKIKNIIVDMPGAELSVEYFEIIVFFTVLNKN